MVKPFQFARIPKILFRTGLISGLPGIIKSYGRSVVLVTGKNNFLSSDQGIKLLFDLEINNIDLDIVKISGEPSPEDIDHAVMSLGDKKVDVVAGIGGGSVLDAGKAISAMIHRRESVVDFLEVVGNKEHPGTKIPFIAMPTTSGTGSEATKNAVITRVGIGGFKRSLRHDNFVPDLALIDPELTVRCPRDITAASGMDCFTQLTEAYLSDKSCEYTDALALEGLKAVRYSLVRSCNDGYDIEARSGMAFAALTSGICLANAGLGVVHGFASSIGGMYKIPHGLVCGTLMAVSNEINVRELRKSNQDSAPLKKYALLGELFLGQSGKSESFYIDAFVSYLHDLTDNLNLPGLKNAGVLESDLNDICRITECKNNPVKLTVDDLHEILSKRFV